MGGLEDTMGDGASLDPLAGSSRQLGSRGAGRGPIAAAAAAAAAASTLASTVAQIVMILFTNLLVPLNHWGIYQNSSKNIPLRRVEFRNWLKHHRKI